MVIFISVAPLSLGAPEFRLCSLTWRDSITLGLGSGLCKVTLQEEAISPQGFHLQIPVPLTVPAQSGAIIAFCHLYSFSTCQTGGVGE